MTDFDAILSEARQTRRCAECGEHLDHRKVRARSTFCGSRCRLRFRDRRRYEENPDAERERARRYYQQHREQVLERTRARRRRAADVGNEEPRS